MKNTKIKGILESLHYNEESTTNEISSFRMVLHRTHSIKMSLNSKKCDSFRQYFVLLWIPCNGVFEAKRPQYQKLILTLNEEKYFCNKLNKQCLYFSGSKYGTDTTNNGEFRLQSLYDKCKIHAEREVKNGHQLIIDIAIHQFVRKVCLITSHVEISDIW